MNRLLALAAALFSGAALYWSLRWAAAGDPQNAAYQIELARALPPSATDAAVMAHIDRALAVTPTNPIYWAECGDIAEQRHNFPRAGSCLEHAVAIDRTFGTRWLLADYYARRRDPRFWPTVRAAFTFAYDDDLTLLFDTCWSFTANPAEILPRAIPDRPKILTLYLNYLLDKHAPERIVDPVAARAPASLRYCDYLVWHNRPAPAIPLWNALAPRAPLSPSQGVSLTDPDGNQPVPLQAFGRRTLAGVTGIAVDSESGARFEFSGKQPEHAELLSQFVPLVPGRAYTLTVRYATSATADTGLHIRLFDAATRIDLLEPSAPLPPGYQARTLRFTTAPEGTGLYCLAITIDRTLGALRFEGSFHVTSLALGFAL